MMGRTVALVLAAGVATTQAQTLDQSRAYAAELMADATARQSSLAPAAQDFTPAIHGFTQFRFNWNHRDDSGLDSNNNKETIGFQNARTKLIVNGNIANENWGYTVMFKFEDPGSGAAVLDDAYGTYKIGNGWGLKFGQFKLPLYREELVGDQYQLFANRSVVNAFFTQSRSQGVQVGYEGDQFHVYGAVSDGLSTKNTDFTSGSEADIALTARGEWKWAGDWKQAKDFTSFQNSEFFGMVGAAINWQTGGDTVGTADQDVLDLTLDASVEGNGWNAFAAFCFRNTDPTGGPTLTDYGFLIQGGIFVAADWEITAGYNVLVPDSDHAPADSNFNTIQVGVNHYIVPESHALKITVDWQYFFDKQASTAIALANTQVGLLASSKDSQWNLRGQIQLMF
jgi:hypothetical protein